MVGYTAVKAHFLDIGAKDYFCTDTVDYFQEGTIFPGVKLYEAGRLHGGHLAHGHRQLSGSQRGGG